MAEPGASNACEICGGTPHWTIVRQGDAVVTWSCGFSNHLGTILTGLQRDHEVTQLVVTLTSKAREVAEINRMIRETMPPRETTG